WSLRESCRHLGLCDVYEQCRWCRILRAWLKMNSDSTYPRLKDTSFTGVTVEDCKMILATDILKQMEDMKKGTWKKLREKFYAKKPEEDSK
uniref:Mitochondrial nucleoid factor 1 n=1 Tax=Bubo bubo TaxID=30461 RepID=A0A8C0EX71_BUBBB